MNSLSVGRRYPRLTASRRPGGGQALVEWLVAAPVLLIVGLGALQVALVVHARLAVAHAAHQAIREAITDHGRNDAVGAGLARGLQPFWSERNLAAALARLQVLQADGGIRWRRTAPVAAAFDDFGETARDDRGRLLTGQIEIPNDNLAVRAMVRGARSGLTLLEANRLALEIQYAVPLVVPLVGPLFGRLVATLRGCAPAQRRQLVTASVNLQSGPAELADIDCRAYRAGIPDGDGAWRWPLRVRVSAMMHSPLWPDAAAAGSGAPASSATGPGPARPASQIDGGGDPTGSGSRTGDAGAASEGDSATASLAEVMLPSAGNAPASRPPGGGPGSDPGELTQRGQCEQ
ncbi:MAG: TadE/TadG family type IV pilus assembly protein [Burkholderiaceae bacterium]